MTEDIVISLVTLCESADVGGNCSLIKRKENKNNKDKWTWLDHQKEESENKRSNKDQWGEKLGKIVIILGKKRDFHLFLFYSTESVHSVCIMLFCSDAFWLWCLGIQIEAVPSHRQIFLLFHLQCVLVYTAGDTWKICKRGWIL